MKKSTAKSSASAKLTSIPNGSAAPRIAIAIMAAGKGTRLKSQIPKVLHEVGGKPLLEHVIRAAASVVGASDVYAIVGYEADRVREAVRHTGINFVLQAEQRGTGHALMMAADALARYDHVVVLSGDAPMITATTIESLRDFHLRERAAMTLLSAELANPTGYGRVLHKKPGSPEVREIVEEIAPATVIDPYVQLLGKTKIGGGCRVRSYCVIRDSDIGDSVMVRPGCIMEKAKIGAGAIIGPYSHLRPESEIAEGAHVGNFVETKKIKLGKGSKANHLTYLGDAQIGAGVNIGAGTITCNYDGVHKHKTVIEDDVFIGSDSTLVAPVRIRKRAYVGAASCITDDVPEDSLAVGRGRQVVKEGWARQKREERAKK